MTIAEVIELYKETIPIVFKKKKAKSVKESALKALDKRKILPFQVVPYTQDGLKAAILSKFGNSMSDDIKYKGCLAGAVAREFNQDPNYPDTLHLFDALDSPPQPVSSILLASSDAPTFFPIPVKVGLKEYIDGGVLGNCPLQEALPKCLKNFGPGAFIQSVLSIAPPRLIEDVKVEELKSHWSKATFAVKYIIHQVTDGYSIYAHCKKAYETTHFTRLSQESDAARMFKMDEVDVAKMMAAVKEEFETSKSYVSKIFDAAAVIAARNVTKPTEDMIAMFTTIANTLYNRGNYADCIFVCKEILQVMDADGEFHSQKNQIADFLVTNNGYGKLSLRIYL